MKPSAQETLKDIFKSLSYKLHQELKNINSSISRAQSLDILANSIGKTNWNEYVHSDLSLPSAEECLHIEPNGKIIDIFKHEKENGQHSDNVDLNLSNIFVKLSYLDKPIEIYIKNIAQLIGLHPAMQKAPIHYFGEGIIRYNPFSYPENAEVSNITCYSKNGILSKKTAIPLSAHFIDIIDYFSKKQKNPPELFCSCIYKNKYSFQNLITQNPKFTDNDYLELALKVEISLSNPLKMNISEMAVTPHGQIEEIFDFNAPKFNWNKEKFKPEMARWISIFPFRMGTSPSILGCDPLNSPASVFWPKNLSVA